MPERIQILLHPLYVYKTIGETTHFTNYGVYGSHTGYTFSTKGYRNSLFNCTLINVDSR